MRCWIRRSASRPFSSLLPARTTSALAVARPSAVSYPRPPVAPVTTASLPFCDGISAMVHVAIFRSSLSLSTTSAYALIWLYKKSSFAGDARPKHREPRAPVCVRFLRVLAHELHRGLRQGTHRRRDELLRQVLKDAVCDRFLRHRLNLSKRRRSCGLGLLAEAVPNFNLLEDLVRHGMGDAPLHILIPDMLQSMAHACLARKAGHHGIRQFQLDVAIQRIHEFILRFEIDE